MSHHALIEKPEQETIYQTEHFEAVPYGRGKYVLVHRDSRGHFACGREFPAEVARIAVEAIEAGFFSWRSRYERVRHEVSSAVCSNARNGACEEFACSRGKATCVIFVTCGAVTTSGGRFFFCYNGSNFLLCKKLPQKNTVSTP